MSTVAANKLAPVEAPAAESPVAEPPKTSRRPILIGIGAAAVLGVIGYVVLHRGIEETDDAQIDGDVVTIPARTGGLVTAVHFKDNELVTAGKLLVEIDPKPSQARLSEAEAELLSAIASSDAAAVQAHLSETNAVGQQAVARASLKGAQVGISTTTQQILEADASVRAAKAALQKADIDLKRAKGLVALSAMPQAQLETAQASYDAAEAQWSQSNARAAGLRASNEQVAARVSEASARLTQANTVDQQIADARAKARVAEARVATATAARDLAKLDFDYTQIRAPHDGVVSRRAVNIGQLIAAGSGVAALVPVGNLWVTGNFKETQLAKMHAGQPAKIKVDAFGLELEGQVESFSAATGARFSLLPPDNATGNYTKVVQRVPVRVTLTNVPKNVLLRPGLSVELSVDTRK